MIKFKFHSFKRMKTDFKNTTSLISRILFLNYHLSSTNIAVGVLLPTLELERVVLKRSFTWHYSTQGLPYKTITCLIRALLPHVFTFSSCEVVIFCGTFSVPITRNAGYSPVGYPMLSGLSLVISYHDSSGL